MHDCSIDWAMVPISAQVDDSSKSISISGTMGDYPPTFPPAFAPVAPGALQRRTDQVVGHFG